MSNHYDNILNLCNVIRENGWGYKPHIDSMILYLQKKLTPIPNIFDIITLVERNENTLELMFELAQHPQYTHAILCSKYFTRIDYSDSGYLEDIIQILKIIATHSKIHLLDVIMSILENNTQYSDYLEEPDVIFVLSFLDYDFVPLEPFFELLKQVADKSDTLLFDAIRSIPRVSQIEEVFDILIENLSTNPDSMIALVKAYDINSIINIFTKIKAKINQDPSEHLAALKILPRMLVFERLYNHDEKFDFIKFFIDNNHFKLLELWCKRLNNDEVIELISYLIEVEVDEENIFKALLSSFNNLYESNEIEMLIKLIENNNCFYQLIYESDEDNDMISDLQDMLSEFGFLDEE